MSKTTRITWRPAKNNGHLIIEDDRLPGRNLKVWYVEIYMRRGSRLGFPGGVIRHTTRLVDADPQGSWLKLRCQLEDGVIVDHDVSVDEDAVDFRTAASNPTASDSPVAWGAPCVIVDEFTGCDKDTYLPKCFVCLDDKVTRLPVQPWATEAIETPGQVWCPQHVDPDDVESHPLSELTCSNGLIGCFSADERMVMAVAWQPYQNLFQGIIACLHADFRIDGLRAGQTKQSRGRIYLVEADMARLLDRYGRDFPEHGEVGGA